MALPGSGFHPYSPTLPSSRRDDSARRNSALRNTRLAGESWRSVFSESQWTSMGGAPACATEVSKSFNCKFPLKLGLARLPDTDPLNAACPATAIGRPSGKRADVSGFHSPMLSLATDTCKELLSERVPAARI